MNESFKKYIDAELSSILGCMDEQCRCNPQKRTEKALDWIEKNAREFRNRWSEKKSTDVDGRINQCSGTN